MSENWYGPRIKQIGNYLNDQYDSGAFPLGIVNLEGLAVASPAQTPLLADRDPVLQEICVGMSGVETQVKTVNGVPPLLITDAIDCRAFNCAVSYEPQQDLHGYEAPWPAGGGKNKFEVTVDKIASLNTHGTWNDNVYTDRDVTFTINADGTVKVNGTASETCYLYLGDFETGTENYTLNGWQGSYSASLALTGIVGASWYSVQSASGRELPQSSTVSVRIYLATGATADNLVFSPMIRLSSVTDATFAPYSNICPISGWTGAEVTVAGKNLFNWDRPQGTPNPTAALVSPRIMDTEHYYVGITRNNYYGTQIITSYSVDNGTVSVSVSAGGYGIGYPVSVIPNQVYTVSFTNVSNAKISVGFYDVDWNFISHIDNITYFTSPQNAAYVILVITPIVITDGAGTAIAKDIQLELGSSPSTYTPYRAPSTASVTFPTSYGGTADVVAGTGSETMAEVDLGTLNWSKVGTSAYPIWRADLQSAKDGIGTGGMRNAFCNSYKMASSGGAIYNGTEDKCFIINTMFLGGQGYIYIRDSDFDSLTGSDVKTALSGVKVVYELATPTDFTFTPAPLDLAKGDNYIWSDTNGNDISVTYVAEK